MKTIRFGSYSFGGWISNNVSGFVASKINIFECPRSSKFPWISKQHLINKWFEKFF